LSPPVVIVTWHIDMYQTWRRPWDPRFQQFPSHRLLQLL